MLPSDQLGGGIEKMGYLLSDLDDNKCKNRVDPLRLIGPRLLFCFVWLASWKWLMNFFKIWFKWF